jgi:hypothetical protein
VVVDASGTLPTVDRLYFGSETGAVGVATWHDRLTYWPRRLSNTLLNTVSLSAPAEFQDPTIAILAVGAALELPTWLPQGFDPAGREVVGSVARNANGQPLGRAVDFEQWQQTITLQSVAWSWVRDTWEQAWRAHLRSSPFGVCWEPASYASEVRLVVAGEQFATPHRSGLLADLQFDVSGVVE